MSTEIAAWTLGAIALAGGAATLGYAMRIRRRVGRLAEGAAEFERGNFAHRILLPGNDETAAIADSLNRAADSVQAERDASARRDDARRRLITDVSHDLRTPITSIAGYVDALQRGLGDEPARYLMVVAQKSEELSRLTDDLFYMTRIDADELELSHGPVDLAEIVRQTVLGFEPQLSSREVAVTVRIPEGRCVVSADESALRRVLGNLIGNSVRHAEGMTRFDVEMTGRDGSWEVRILNDGPPLAPDAEVLFLRGASGGGGPGLGLSIARELSERMGASVRGETGEAGGAVFTLRVPMAHCGEFINS